LVDSCISLRSSIAAAKILAAFLPELNPVIPLNVIEELAAAAAMGKYRERYCCEGL
jgi:hypothetical protein